MGVERRGRVKLSTKQGNRKYIKREKKKACIVVEVR